MIDKYHFRALQMSLVVHAMFVLILIAAGSFFKPSDRLLVVDFRMDDSPNGGDRIFATSEIKPNRDIMGRKAASAKVAERKQKDQEPANEKQREVPPLRTSAEISETPASEKLQVMSQVNADALPTDTVQSFATFPRSQNISPGRAGSAVGSSDATGTVTTSGKIGYRRGPGGQSNQKGEYLRKNFSYIRDRIQKRIIYPPLARRMGWEGDVTVSFIIVSDGQVNEIKVKESSGRDILDKSAVETIRSASPFPAPPIEAQIIIPILYRLN